MSLPPRLKRYATAFAAASAATGVDALLLAAVCDRESRGGLALNPPGPGGLGDSGHGHGLMQIDGRSWATWLGTHEWWVPAVNIAKGASILATNLGRFQAAFDPLFCAVVAYNAGPGNVHACLKSLPATATDEDKREALDRRTTGRNYATDVLERWREFQSTKEKQSA